MCAWPDRCNPTQGGFRDELRGLGYRPNAAADQLRLMAHMSRWLQARRLGVGDLTPERVEGFLADRRAEGYTEALRLDRDDIDPHNRMIPPGCGRSPRRAGCRCWVTRVDG